MRRFSSLLAPHVARQCATLCVEGGFVSNASCTTQLNQTTRAAHTLLLQRLGAQVDSWHSQWHQTHLSHYSTSKSYADEVETINNLFIEARDEIDYAKEDSETVYFNESVTTARKAVDACIERWESLLSRLDEQEKGRLQRSMGLKMEQLKAEFDEVAKLHLED